MRAADRPIVVHVVGDDTPAGRRETLTVLLGRDEIAGRQHVAVFGRTKPDLAGLRPVAQITRLRFGDPVAAVARRLAAADEGPIVVHIWSPAAIEWCGGASTVTTTMASCPRSTTVLDFEFPADPRRRLASAGVAVGEIDCVVSSATMAERVLQAGVSPQRCALIRESVDFGRITAIDRDSVRARLGLAGGDVAVLIVPPVERACGPLLGAWAALILDRIRDDVRLVLPGVGREPERIERLLIACDRGDRLRRSFDRQSLDELMVACDVAVFLPTVAASTSGIVSALAVGRPIVAAAVASVAELLSHGHNARLARPGSPRHAAQRLLEAIESADESRRMTALGQAQALRVFSRQRMIEQYARLYRNVAAGIPAAEGIHDAACRA